MTPYFTSGASKCTKVFPWHFCEIPPYGCIWECISHLCESTKTNFSCFHHKFLVSASWYLCKLKLARQQPFSICDATTIVFYNLSLLFTLDAHFYRILLLLRVSQMILLGIFVCVCQMFRCRKVPIGTHLLCVSVTIAACCQRKADVWESLLFCGVKDDGQWVS